MNVSCTFGEEAFAKLQLTVGSRLSNFGLALLSIQH
jgi:hypothetical protein